jgi:hypothetical protein
MHERPGNGSQSEGAAHSYSLLLWLMEQLLAATIATTSAVSQAATSFMVWSP